MNNSFFKIMIGVLSMLLSMALFVITGAIDLNTLWICLWLAFIASILAAIYSK